MVQDTVREKTAVIKTLVWHLDKMQVNDEIKEKIV